MTRPDPSALIEALNSGDCQHCDGTGIDQDVIEGRGYSIDCEFCGGSGCEQEDDPDMMPGGVDDL